MATDDEDKTTFHTEKGTFCYPTLTFGLQNAGATYQRLVDKLFTQQVGRNVEETLKRLQQTNMKLNLKKCIFGVQRGKFLGHTVTERRIEANPQKIESLLKMKTPRTMKEV